MPSSLAKARSSSWFLQAFTLAICSSVKPFTILVTRERSRLLINFNQDFC